MAMTKEEMRLQEIEDVLYEIKDAVAAIEFNKATDKPFEKHEARLNKAMEKAEKLQIKAYRINIYVDIGLEEAEECLKEQGF